MRAVGRRARVCCGNLGGVRSGALPWVRVAGREWLCGWNQRENDGISSKRGVF